MDDRAIFDIYDYRRALGTFASGVTVVTTIDKNGAPRGFTANSFASVSLDPPLILVCVAKSAGSYLVFAETSFFAVNILAEYQKHISGLFASKANDRFKAVRWSRKSSGAPVLEAVSAWLDCRMSSVVNAGDHAILIGRVVDYAYGSARPLGYCGGAYISFAVAQEAIDAGENRASLQFGAIVEYRRAILLETEPRTENLVLPVAHRFGNSNDMSGLKEQLLARGINLDVAFPFEVIDDSARNKHTIFYRCEARDVSADQHLNFIPFEAIPWRRIRDTKQREMLQSYVFEREQDDIII